MLSFLFIIFVILNSFIYLFIYLFYLFIYFIFFRQSFETSANVCFASVVNLIYFPSAVREREREWSVWKHYTYFAAFFLFIIIFNY